MSSLRFYLRREWLSLILAGAFGALLLNCLYGPLGPRDLLILRHHRATLTAERDRLAAENARLGRNLSRLQSDDAYLEGIIRQELGYVRAGEIVYRFPPSQAPTGP